MPVRDSASCEWLKSATIGHSSLEIECLLFSIPSSGRNTNGQFRPIPFFPKFRFQSEMRTMNANIAPIALFF